MKTIIQLLAAENLRQSMDLTTDTLDSIDLKVTSPTAQRGSFLPLSTSFEEVSSLIYSNVFWSTEFLDDKNFHSLLIFYISQSALTITIPFLLEYFSLHLFYFNRHFNIRNHYSY